MSEGNAGISSLDGALGVMGNVIETNGEQVTKLHAVRQWLDESQATLYQNLGGAEIVGQFAAVSEAVEQLANMLAGFGADAEDAQTQLAALGE